MTRLRDVIDDDIISDHELTKSLRTQGALQQVFFKALDEFLFLSFYHNEDRSIRDRARLLCISEGDSSWLSAIPNPKKFSYLNKSQFCSVFKYWYGIPCQVPRKCRCGRDMDIWGDHALSCKSGGGVVHRHNTIQRVLLGFCADAGMEPLKELSDYRLHAKDRIGDLVLPYEDHGRELLVNVTCWNPLYSPRLNMSSVSPLHTVKMAHKDKTDKRNLDDDNRIDTQFGRLKYMPFAVDTFGGRTSQANDLLRRIAQELAVKQAKPFSECFALVKMRVSIAIQVGVAVCLLIRNIDARLHQEDPVALLEEGFCDSLLDQEYFSDEEEGLLIEDEFDLP